ncbi:MAG: imidazole glycerol phosphate synthase subunit HisH [Parcubacteria group bacterium]|nr:imidazole glycerol phosphate synthase subunit HisH [Parcubacteria group bacterium]
MKKILIIDYGLGNLFGLKKALAYAGADVSPSEHPEDISGADALVLPGVGAFGDGMAEFEKRGFKQAVLDEVKAGKPLLGICLGMQFLFDKSYEFGEQQGLGIIPGEVKKISVPNEPFCKIPHIGWNTLLPPDGDEFRGHLLKGIKPGSQAYFVHSYAGYPTNLVDVAANTWYCKSSIPAVIEKENTYGVQFHPEKSGTLGIQIFKNFFSLV